MGESSRPFRPFLLRWVAVFFGIFMVAAAANGATLYESSLDKLQKRAVKASPTDFTFVVMGDSRDNDPVFRKTLALAKTFNPLFILHGGDYSSYGTLSETDRFLAMVRAEVPDIPFFVVYGNHEERKVFEKMVGPLDYTLDDPRLDLRIVAVDNAHNALRPAEISYLREQLGAKRRFTFVIMHVPPRTKRWSWHSFTDGADDLLRLLAENRVTMAFFAHVHIYDRDELKGIPAIITGGAGAPLVRVGYPGEAVYHLVVVRVKDGSASATMVPVTE